MIIVAWILLIAFGTFSLSSLLSVISTGISIGHAMLMFVAIVVTALSAGVIWGGLLN